MIFNRKRQLEKEQTKLIKGLVRFTDDLIDNTIRKLYVIQDVQSLGISEKDKDMQRNIIINKTVNELLEYSSKIKELSKTVKSIR